MLCFHSDGIDINVFDKELVIRPQKTLLLLFVVIVDVVFFAFVFVVNVADDVVVDDNDDEINKTKTNLQGKFGNLEKNSLNFNFHNTDVEF